MKKKNSYKCDMYITYGVKYCERSNIFTQIIGSD